MWGNSRRVPRFSRPLREAGKFADISTSRKGQERGRPEGATARTWNDRNVEGHDFSRAAKHRRCPRLQPLRDCRRKRCPYGADAPVNERSNRTLVILRPASFAGRRIYGLVGSTTGAGRLHRSFGAKGQRLRMTRVQLANGMCGTLRRVPRFSRPLREAGRFAVISTNREGQEGEGRTGSGTNLE